MSGSQTLCPSCKRIPAYFFDHDERFMNPSFCKAQRPEVEHLPVKRMKRSADDGCPLCKVFVQHLDADFLSPEVQEQEPTWLRRGYIDPHSISDGAKLNGRLVGDMQIISLLVGMEEVENRRTSCAPVAGDDALAVVKYWLEDCTTTHLDCQSKSSDCFVPSRLLDLDAPGDGRDICLVEMRCRQNSEQVAYTALSHCWGTQNGHVPERTLTENLRSHTTRINYSDLCLTFRDAVDITRFLGVRYLWIDSLCIVQDSPADKEAEMSRMRQVYGRAYCTLAASSSQSGQDGCRRGYLETRPGSAPLSFDLRFEDFTVRIFSSHPLGWDWEVDSGPLRTRGWTLQEQELSPRVVHFCKNLLLWECKSLKASNEIPWREISTDDPSPLLLLNRPEDLLDQYEGLLQRGRWFKTVENFTARDISEPFDRLPALDGLVQRDKQHGRGEYLAGLWCQDLPSALLWRSTDARKSRPANTGLPSWSWASIDGSVTYDSQRSQQVYHLDDDARVLSECDFGSFTIEDVQVVQESENSASRVIQGLIRASGVLWPAKARPGDVAGAAFMVIETIDGHVAGVLYPDTNSFNNCVLSILFCRIRSEPGRPEIQIPNDVSFVLGAARRLRGPMCMGLALVEESENCYKRVGLVRYVREECVKDVRTRQFSIV